MDLTLELTGLAGSIRGALNQSVQRAIGDLVRSMNCYYSNFLEGHETRPESIERAIHTLSEDASQRSRQLLARAHIDVQRKIDLDETPDLWPAHPDYLKWIHKNFSSRLPDELLWVTNPDTSRRVRVVPGEWRTDHVQVGQHRAPAPNEIASLMSGFQDAYDPTSMGTHQRLVSVAASHHRFVWIHPFADGNGRVARLMSHALLLKLGVGSTLWSVSRGLARNADAYRRQLAAADSVRQGDFDGRGALTASGLVDFCRFFLEVCVDQIRFMLELLQPDELLPRIRRYVDEEIESRRLPKKAFSLIREAFLAGEIPRGKASEITGYEERRARETLSSLLERGLLVPDGPKAPVRLGIPIHVVERWLPGLYPVGVPEELRQSPERITAIS